MKTFTFTLFTDNVKMMVKDIIKTFDKTGNVHVRFYLNKNNDIMTISLNKKGGDKSHRIYVHKDLVNADNYDQYMLKYFNITRNYIFEQ